MVKLKIRARSFARGLKVPTFVWRAAALCFVKALNVWMSSLNYRVYRYQQEAEPASEHFAGPAIFVFWHEYIPLPIFLRPHCRLSMLLSHHQDAEILSHVASFAGLETVRGSTSRGGHAALMELIQRGKGMSLAITPDGPRGPRRKLAQGCVYLSSRLQIPIIPIGFGYDRPWRNKRAWDQFAIPRPFSRCRAIVGPRIQVPAGLSRDEIEEHRGWIEQQLNMLTEHAEDWAAGDFNIANSEILYRQSPPTSRPSQPSQVSSKSESKATSLRVAG